MDEPSRASVDLDNVKELFPRRGVGFLHSIEDKASMVRGGYRAGKRAAEKGLDADGLLFAGMGFSGVTANLVQDAATRALDCPFTVVKHYQFPRHVKPGWQCLAVSYSGETEETLSVVKTAKERGVPITAFTCGGTISTLADRIVRQPNGFQPRAAFAFTWFSILGWLEGSGLLQEKVPVKETVEALRGVDRTCGPEVPESYNEAKQIARLLWHKIPQIYATPAFYGVGQHFRGMLNENAKKISDVDLVPESNHNDLTAWSGDIDGRKLFTVLELSHENQNPELRKRLQYMRRRYTEWGVPWHAKVFPAVNSFADHVVAQATAIQFLDYTSVYVAALKGEDPSDIREIRSLKGYLRGQAKPGAANASRPVAVARAARPAARKRTS
ncbi:MAG TPA: SIS domain-containing protein [Candidatus Thermoplasmatota archaeon]|nr:SIS domain-containing protein [Candidatus Thermoplasmatota archaeon]